MHALTKGGNASLSGGTVTLAIAVAGVEADVSALLLGAEGPGLSAEALERADVRVRIPMSGDVDSLNVATAAAIALHHFTRGIPATPGADPRSGPPTPR